MFLLLGKFSEPNAVARAAVHSRRNQTYHYKGHWHERKGQAVGLPSRASRSNRRLRLRRILSAGLRRRRVEALFLPLQARLARPGALQVITHLEAQLAETRALQLDRVAVQER